MNARSRKGPVLLTLALGIGVFALTQSTWITARTLSLAGTLTEITVTGADAAPATLAFALVALASALVFAISRRTLARVCAVVIALSGLAVGASAILVVASPATAAAPAVAEATGILSADVRAVTSSWPWVAVLAGALLAATGVWALIVAGSVPRTRSTRYARRSAAPKADLEHDDAAAWDALSQGEDPTSADDPQADDERGHEESPALEASRADEASEERADRG